MHILWLVRTTLPQAAAACGLAGASDVSGSWLTGQLAALRACPDLHLTVLCVGKADADGTADGVHYRVVRDTAAFAPLLQAERPDLVHIWGTEFDPATGEFVPGGITEQTRQVLTNIKAILTEAGLTMDNVVKTTVFLQNMSDFAAMNAVYAEFFTEGQYPARSAVEVGALPRGALVEIETIFVK